MPAAEYLGLAEIAERIGLKRSTLYVYHSTGRMPDPDLIVNDGATPLWKATTIEAWDRKRPRR